MGSRETNLSGGIGFSYADNNWVQKPVFSLSGMVRTARWFSLISDNYLIRSERETTTLLSLGGRFLFRRVGLDTALGVPVISDEGIYAFPWFGLHLLLGSPKN